MDSKVNGIIETPPMTGPEPEISGRPNPHFRCIGLARAFGFDGASYFLFADNRAEAKPIAHWSSADEYWLRVYRRNELHLVDPRFAVGVGESSYVIWSARGDTPTAHRFQRLGARFGVGSGVAVSVCDDRMGRGIVSWEFSEADLRSEQISTIKRALDTLAIVSGLFLEAVWSRPHLHRHNTEGEPCLTARESECLALAANGMTSGDISVKLGISQRTANFHFGNIIAKLQVLNRGEAIARAIALGLYQPPPRAWGERCSQSTPAKRLAHC